MYVDPFGLDTLAQENVVAEDLSNKNDDSSDNSSIDWAYWLDADGNGYYRRSHYRVREAIWFEW